MKKVAFVGSSNTLMKGGYAHICKNILGDNCDIYAIGSSSSLINLFLVLKHSLVGRYKYIIFQFNPLDSFYIENNLISKELLIAANCALIRLFNNSSSIPVFLILPAPFYPLSLSASYIPRALAAQFSIPLIDIEAAVSISNHYNSHDSLHLAAIHHKLIASRVLELITQSRSELSLCISSPIFTILDIPALDIFPALLVGSSKIKYEVALLSKSGVLTVPETKYLVGIFYWLDNPGLCIAYESAEINILKSLALHKERNLFLFRPIGWYIQQGIMGGHIGYPRKNRKYICEKSWPDSGEFNDINLENISINSLFLCSANPYAWGSLCYFTNFDSFQAGRIKSASIDSEEDIASRLFDISLLDNMLADGSSIFSSVINARQDIAANIASHQWKPEHLLIWANQFGFDELPVLLKHKKAIQDALKAMHEIPAQVAYPVSYSWLLDSIRTMRPDLGHFNPCRKSDRELLIKWFDSYGKFECKLSDII